MPKEQVRHDWSLAEFMQRRFVPAANQAEVSEIIRVIGSQPVTLVSQTPPWRIVSAMHTAIQRSGSRYANPHDPAPRVNVQTLGNTAIALVNFLKKELEPYGAEASSRLTNA